jgi:hypothetical protein
MIKLKNLPGSTLGGRDIHEMKQAEEEHQNVA